MRSLILAASLSILSFPLLATPTTPEQDNAIHSGYEACLYDLPVCLEMG